ncbi:MAG: small ribosomal subunit Rsm22 family protein [Beijerinckiaceae bacterium]
MSALPSDVRAALDALLKGRSRRDLAERSQGISENYRDRLNSSKAVRAEADALSYAIARMPATYAAMAHALGEMLRAAPDLSPRTLIDIGCGPGTAAIAAVSAFPQIESAQLCDRNKPFLDLARKLTMAMAERRAVTFKTLDIDARDLLPPADLVTAGYVLSEVFEGDVVAVGRKLWTAAGLALIITEPGTPEGFRRLRAVRADLIEAGAHVAAPCTHHAACPMSADQWCRVPVRLQRSRDHRALKGGFLAYEDEPVAYLALTRSSPMERAGRRIVGPARVSKVEAALPACGPEGLTTLVAASRDAPRFRALRKLDWGDAV